MSHAAPIVTTEHMQRAYAQLREADWPSFDEMQRMATQFAIVRGRACDLANGRTLPPEPAGTSAPYIASSPIGYAGITTARIPGLMPSPTPSARANGQTERRRRDDHLPAVDLKSRAAGERDDD